MAELEGDCVNPANSVKKPALLLSVTHASSCLPVASLSPQRMGSRYLQRRRFTTLHCTFETFVTLQ